MSLEVVLNHRVVDDQDRYQCRVWVNQDRCRCGSLAVETADFMVVLVNIPICRKNKISCGNNSNINFLVHAL